MRICPLSYLFPIPYYNQSCLLWHRQIWLTTSTLSVVTATLSDEQLTGHASSQVHTTSLATGVSLLLVCNCGTIYRLSCYRTSATQQTVHFKRQVFCLAHRDCLLAPRKYSYFTYLLTVAVWKEARDATKLSWSSALQPVPAGLCCTTATFVDRLKLITGRHRCRTVQLTLWHARL